MEAFLEGFIEDRTIYQNQDGDIVEFDGVFTFDELYKAAMAFVRALEHKDERYIPGEEINLLWSQKGIFREIIPWKNEFNCKCGRHIQLWWNGGELDFRQCACGHLCIPEYMELPTLLWRM